MHVLRRVKGRRCDPIFLVGGGDWTSWFLSTRQILALTDSESIDSWFSFFGAHLSYRLSCLRRRPAFSPSPPLAQCHIVAGIVRVFCVSYLASRFIYLFLCLHLSPPTPSMSGDTAYQCLTRDREIVGGNKVVKSTMSIGCILQSMSGVHVCHYRARIRPKSKQEKCRH